MRNFEDILREKLYEATNDNYSDTVWGNIKEQIPAQKKSKSHFLWMASFMMVFALMITMVQQYPNWKIESQSIKSTESIKDEIRYSSIEILPHSSTLTALNSSQNQKTNKPAFTSITKTTEYSNERDNSYDDVGLRQDIEYNTNTGIAKQNAIPFSFKEDAVQSEYNSSNYNTFISSAYNIPTLHSIESLFPTSTISSTTSLTNSFEFKTDKSLKSSRRYKGNDVHCEVLKGKQSRFYVSARHISSYAFNELTSKNPSADEYMNSRHVTESKRYSFSDEVTFGMEYRNGFFAELGIRYDQINEKFSYLDPNAYQSATVVTIDTILIADEPEVLIDTVTTVLAGEREILNNNNFKKLSVPFSIGYQYPLNKKVSLAAKAGLVVNVLSQYNGRMFDEELNITSIEERQKSKNPLFNQLVHSVSASAFLQYQVNKNMELLVGLNTYKNLGSTSYETNPLDQKYSSLGIFVGGKYNL